MTALTEAQWAVLSPLIPEQKFEKGGRPRANDRRTLNGILWVLRTGAQWNEMPGRYGSYVTAWRRLKSWEENETWDQIWKELLRMLDEEGKLDWAMAFLDGSFTPAKKGGLK
jgi:transposase